MDPHLPFIAAAYGISTIVIVGLVIWIVQDYRSLSRAITELEARGVRRRSAGETRS